MHATRRGEMLHWRKAKAQLAPTPPQCSSRRGARHSSPGSGNDFTRAIMSTLTSPSTRISPGSTSRLSIALHFITSPDMGAFVHLSTQESDASDSRYHAEMNTLREFGSKSRLEDQLDVLISVRDDVGEALERRAPVVALESTVIAHGLPRPHNLETARKMEAVVREAGATPAL